MADEPNTTDTSDDSREQFIPRNRFDQVIAARNLAEARAADLEAQLNAARDEQLTANQQWQELAEQRAVRIAELEPVAAQVTAMQAALQNRVDAEIAMLPEEKRPLVPAYDDPAQTLEWLSRNAALLRKPTAPGLDGGAVSSAQRQAPEPAALTDAQREAAIALGRGGRLDKVEAIAKRKATP